MLLGELGFEQQEPSMVHCDNQSAIYLVRNAQHREATKHIDIKYLCIRECIQMKEIRVEHCPTEDMVADMLTKAISAAQMAKLSAMCGLAEELVVHAS